MWIRRTVALLSTVVLMAPGCGSGAGPEAEQFEPVIVHPGQILRCVRSGVNIVFDGAGTARFTYADSTLFLHQGDRSAPIVPIPPEESIPLSPPEIARMRRIYPEVPRIDEILLAQGLDPGSGGRTATDAEWYAAFEQWLDEVETLGQRCIDLFGSGVGAAPSSARMDSFALACVDTLRASPLVEQASAEGLGAAVYQRTLQYRNRGESRSSFLILIPYDYVGRRVPVTGVSEERARRHYEAIALVLGSGYPAIIDLSTGTFVSLNP